jgi:hypothetical protein
MATTSCLPVVGLSLISGGRLTALSGTGTLLGLLLLSGLTRIGWLVLGSLVRFLRIGLVWLIHCISPYICRQGTSFAFAMPAAK